jgi:hypothetical protein
MLLFDPPPLLARQSHPAALPLDELVRLHRAQVRRYLATNPGVTIRATHDRAGVVAAQQRQHLIKGVHREMVGGMSADEIRRFGGFTRERSARLKRLLDGENPAAVSSDAAAPVFSTEPANETNHLETRLIGALALAAALVLGYFGYYRPWQQALAGAASLSLSLKACVGAVMALGTGLPWLFCPGAFTRIFGPPSTPGKLTYLYAGTLAVAGWIAFVFFKQFLIGILSGR